MLFLILFFFMFSCFPFIMYWVWQEKKSPFYYQSSSAWIYLATVLLVTLFLSIYMSIIDRADVLNVHSLSSLAPFFSAYNLESMLVINNYTLISSLLIVFFSFIIVLFSFYYSKTVRLNYFETPVYILFAVLAMIFLVCSNNLLVTYVAIELQSFAFYLLAASQRKSILSVESGLKYLFIGSVGSGLLVLSFSFVYFLFGTLDVSQIYLFFSLLTTSDSDFFFTFSVLFFFLLAFFIKLGFAPFHLWVADVYEGAPTYATIFFLVIPKIAVFSIFVRLLYSIFFSDLLIYLDFFFLPVIVSSFLFGYMGALKNGITLKRFYAYSGITHLGFIALPLSMNFVNPSSLNFDLMEIVYPVFYYIVLYALITIVSARLLLNFISTKVLSTGRQLHYVLENLPSTYNYYNPAHALSIFLIFMIFIGIPPTAGFFLKLFPLLSVLSNKSFVFLILVIWPFISLSAYVYARILVLFFFKNTPIWKINTWKSVTSSDFLVGWISFFLIIYLSTYVIQPNVISMLIGLF